MYKFVISFLIIFVCVFLTNQINIKNSTTGTAHDKIFDQKPSYWKSLMMKKIYFPLKNGVEKINQVKQQILKRLLSKKTRILPPQIQLDVSQVVIQNITQELTTNEDQQNKNIANNFNQIETQNNHQNVSRQINENMIHDRPNTNILKEDDLFYVNDIVIPPSFDARQHWENCTIIGEIIDQGRCGNCWATVAIGVLSDRLCIATKGQVNKLLSVEQLTFCCEDCENRGCVFGNKFNSVWHHLINYGVVTGGHYSTTDGCQPYRVMPCFDNVGKFICSERPIPDHECFKGCYGNSSIDFEKDHWKAKDAYWLEYKNIQKEILLYGPIQTYFRGHQDFINYKNGIFKKSSITKEIGKHSVKIIGWGEEEGVKYWLCVNSFGKYWGENGLFRIIRGTDEYSFESWAYAGRPLVFEKEGIYYPFDPYKNRYWYRRVYD